jgi:hypothetical protein
VKIAVELAKKYAWHISKNVPLHLKLCAVKYALQGNDLGQF